MYHQSPRHLQLRVLMRGAVNFFSLRAQANKIVSACSTDLKNIV